MVVAIRIFPLGKSTRRQKPPCVLLKMLGFSAAIFIRFAIGMQAFSPSAPVLIPACIVLIPLGGSWAQFALALLQIYEGPAGASVTRLSAAQTGVAGRAAMVLSEAMISPWTNCLDTYKQHDSPRTDRCCNAISLVHCGLSRGPACLASSWKSLLSALPVRASSSVPATGPSACVDAC